MRLGSLLLSAEMTRASVAWAEEPPPLMEAMFCDYVAAFAPQIARNRIRNVPFLRLDEFQYFDPARSRYLERKAQQIYARSPERLRDELDILADTYARDCRDVFDAS